MVRFKDKNKMVTAKAEGREEWELLFNVKYVMTLNCTLKNDENGKCMLRIFPPH